MNIMKPTVCAYGKIYVQYLSHEAVAFLDFGQTPGEWFEKNAARRKADEKKESAIVTGPGNKTFFVKRYLVDSLMQKILYTLYRDQAARTLKLSMQMAYAGISVPEPLAAIKDFESRKKAVYFVSEALIHSRTLKQTMSSIKEQFRVSRLLEQLAARIAGMHKAGFYHGDMKWKNIMVNTGFKNTAYFIDLDAAGRLSSPKDKHYALDLSRFCVDIYERLNSQELIRFFILNYARHAGLAYEKIVQDIRPYHRKISAKHKIKKDSSIPPVNFI